MKKIDFKELFIPIDADDRIDRYFPCSDPSIAYTEEERVILKLYIECVDCGNYLDRLPFECHTCNKKIVLNEVQASLIKELSSKYTIPLIFRNAYRRSVGKMYEQISRHIPTNR